MNGDRVYNAAEAMRSAGRDFDDHRIYESAPAGWQRVHDKLERERAAVPDSAAEVFVQWKGTYVCADFSCPCGGNGHVDADAAYALRCPECKRVWVLPSILALTVPVEESDYLPLEVNEEG